MEKLYVMCVKTVWQYKRENIQIQLLSQETRYKYPYLSVSRFLLYLPILRFSEAALHYIKAQRDSSVLLNQRFNIFYLI